MSLWAQIKQRRITQIVLTYLMGGWAVLVVVDQVVDREVLPPVVYQVTLTLYLIGIFAALVVGWYHGEKGAQKAPAMEIAMLAGVGLVALGASTILVRNALDEASLNDALNATDLRDIAVLYLDDMSADGSLQAVADGITEGVISALKTVPQLDVRSRNGSRQARALGDVTPDSVARFLEVGALVDGTLDQQGDELRVTVRLLDGISGLPLFSETYRRPLAEVASVGADLAAEVALALRERLGVELRLRRSREDAPNSAAWLQVARAERYLQEADAAVEAQDADGALAAFGAADAELVTASESAPEWAEPWVLRSRVAYERYVFAQSLEDLIAKMQLAVEHADRALELQPDDPGALEWRGTATYRRWLLGREPEEVRGPLLESARADLERAVSLDRSLASVHSTLSHLYATTESLTDAVIAARDAYAEDAFLDVAPDVLWRLVTAQYDLGVADQAEETCEEGLDRFPRNYRFTQCQLLVMTMPDTEPDVERAWELYDELLPLLTERRDYFAAQGRIMVGGVIGRAGLPDSARAVFATARIGTGDDQERELLAFEAAMRSLMGDVDGAVATLESYVVAHPESAPGQHWWWRNLESNPAFQRLQAVH